MLSLTNTRQEESVAPPPSTGYVISGKYPNLSVQVPYLETENIDPHGVADTIKLGLHAQDVRTCLPLMRWVSELLQYLMMNEW